MLDTKEERMAESQSATIHMKHWQSISIGDWAREIPLVWEVSLTNQTIIRPGQSDQSGLLA